MHRAGMGRDLRQMGTSQAFEPLREDHVAEMARRGCREMRVGESHRLTAQL